MQRLKWLALVLVVAMVAACWTNASRANYVTKAEFKTYQESVKKSGQDLEKWIAQVDPFLQWVYQHHKKLCDTPSCDPPQPPPPPPPPGEWGM